MEAGGRRRRGLTERELAVSAETVRAHVRNAVTKLHARTRLHAVVMALERGEIAPYSRDAPGGVSAE